MTTHQPPRRDIVVIGASAGGIPPLLTVMKALPEDFPAAVLIVVHMPPLGESRLPQLLRRVTTLPVVAATPEAPLEIGCVYVAAPDRHLLVQRGHIELSRGPRENHTRPAVDPLFRSAARAYGERVIGVILSGTLYDGSAGLMAIKAYGGYAIVQDPGEAAMSSMPEHALASAAVDDVLRADQIAPRLVALVTVPLSPKEDAMRDEGVRTQETIRDDFTAQSRDQRPDQITMFTCPDCGGVLWQEGVGTSLHFRCHVGHAYAPELLLALKSEGMEGALWACVRLLKEKATLGHQLAARQSVANRNGEQATRLEERARTDEQYVEILTRLLEHPLESPLEQPSVSIT